MNPLSLKKFWIAWIGLSLLIGTVSIIITVIANLNFYNSDNYISRDFEKKSWHNEPSKRVEMIDDMINTKIIDGLSKQEIIELLGEPLDNVGYFKQLNYDMIYNLGMERNPLGVDNEWLLIWLDDGQIVSKYELRTD